MFAPLEERRRQLEKVKRVHQFLRDIEDEKEWVNDRLPIAKSQVYGNSLIQVENLLKKNQSLRNEVEGHEPHLQSVCNVGREMIDEGHPQSEEFQTKINELMELWDELNKSLQERKDRLHLSETAQQVSYC